MEPKVPNYEIVEKLGEGSQSVVYKAFSKKDPQRPLSLKLLKVVSLFDRQKAFFTQRIERLKVLHDPLLTIPRSFEMKEGIPIIIQDYFEGVPLSEWARAQNGISLGDFFTIACTLAQALEKVHEAGIVHGGIKPHNILIEPETLDLRLIDFVTPLDVRHVSHFINDHRFVEGTLPYTSPEQTGRINHRVGFATDLYSTGIIFYELLTGRLPFFSTDPLELIHSHLAEEAPNVHDLDPEIPPVVGRIVARLTLKEPEKRYQSGAGLRADLARCRNEYATNGAISEFPIGRYDRTHRVVFVSRMVGREQEADVILAEYEEAGKGAFRSLFISGLPGIGKTRLIQELQKPIVQHRGYFSSGKFDVYRKNIPYSALIQAFRNLMRTFLTESDERVARWKGRITEALEKNGKVVADVIPELAVLIGPQPEVNPLPPVESRNRFHDAFGRFLSCLASEENPLVLFVDDLQWCDVASFDLLANILANSREHPYLFLIGAYRHNEVDSSHPLTKLVGNIREKAQPLKEIRLCPLETRHCHEMVSHILNSPLSQTVDLAHFIAQLTEGNPLFVSESLSYLHNEDLIFLDERRRWQWNLGKIRQSNMPSSVVALFSSKVQKLPPDTIDMLEYCACLGNRFTSYEVALVRETTLLNTFEMLKPALGQGLLMENRNELQFVHDRVQEAVLSAIEPERRQQIHWQIGQHLLSTIPKEADLEKLDGLFTIVSHLNMGRERTPETETAYLLSDINFHAGNKALDALATEAANEYFQESLTLLPDACWEVQYERTFKIFQKLARTELMCGRYDHSEDLLNQLLDHARADLDKAEALAEQTTSLSSIGSFIKAIETANRGLAFFDKSIPDDAVLAEKKREQLTNEISSKPIDVWDTILNMPFTTERKSKIELAFYSELIPDLYMSGLVPQLYLAAAQSTGHCLAGGMDESVIYSFSIMGLYLGEQGAFEQAFRYEDLAHELSAKYPNTFGATRGMNGVVWCNMHTRSHPEEVVAYCLKSIQSGKNCGDLYNAGLSYGPLMWNLQVQGANLATIEECAKECFEFSEKYHLSFSIGLAEGMQAGWIAPMKREYTPIPMKEKLEQWERDNHVASAGSYCVHMALTHYYFGDYEQAEQYLQDVKRYLSGLTDNILKRQWTIFQVLNALRLFEMGIGPRDREHLLATVRPIVQQLETWAQYGPVLKPYLAFIYAEQERSTGNFRKARSLYLDAIAVAHEQRFVFLEGHLNECLGQLLEDAGQGPSGIFFVEAARLYRKCHAERKELVLREKCAMYFGEESTPAYLSVEAAPDLSHTIPSLDVNYLIKSSHAISAEMDFDVLVRKIMNVVLEASGAQHGYLFMEEEGKLFVRAESHITEKEALRTLKQSLEETENVCKGVVRYVHRTKERIILDDASAAGEFRDDSEVAKMHLRSVLCLPLLEQSRLIGILYLENRLAGSVFTSEQTQMTELLTSQAAISLENARLVDEMKRAERALQEHRDHLEQMVAERTLQLRNAQEGLIAAEKHAGVGRLAAGVAHEIKNQLTPVLTEAQRIIGQIENGERLSSQYVMERARAIESASRAANRITSALLDYARESSLKFERYSIQQSIEGVIALHRTPSSFNIEIALEEMEIGEITADRRQIEQVLVNVLNNAYQAIERKGEEGVIAISVKKEGADAVISVEDNGDGISEENRSKVFDPFFTTESPRGAGLGLSVSYGIIERHGGRIDFESHVGQGTIFRIHLPIEQREIAY
ncbi:MAG: AAA family ATPase [Candidatus Latescibacterota bacterium]